MAPLGHSPPKESVGNLTEIQLWVYGCQLPDALWCQVSNKYLLKDRKSLILDHNISEWLTREGPRDHLKPPTVFYVDRRSLDPDHKVNQSLSWAWNPRLLTPKPVLYAPTRSYRIFNTVIWLAQGNHFRKFFWVSCKLPEPFGTPAGPPLLLLGWLSLLVAVRRT